jgi:predicted nucleic acid-binding Zn ribbon protein
VSATPPGAPRPRRRAARHYPDIDPPEEGKALASSIDALLSERGLSGMRALGMLTERWVELVGPDAARHCRPVRIQRATLTVEVDHPGWATELTFVSPRLVEQLAELGIGNGIQEVKVLVRHGFDVD